jgi:hypothetical protein
MSEYKTPAASQLLEVYQANTLNGRGLDWTRNEWQQLDVLEFLTTIDLRIVLFQIDESSLIASQPFQPLSPARFD